MKFSEKIVRLRKIRGITQDELASAVGVSRQAVYKWECGQSYPEVMKLVEIKALFGISIDDLLDESYEIALPERKKRKRIKKARVMAIEREVEEELGANPVEEVEEEITVVEVDATPAIEDSEDIIRESIIEVEEEPNEETLPLSEIENSSVAVEEVVTETEPHPTVEEPVADVAEEALEEGAVAEPAHEEEVEEEALEEVVAEPTPATEPELIVEAPAPEKKRGFFSRLFGIK